MTDLGVIIRPMPLALEARVARLVGEAVAEHSEELRSLVARITVR